MTHPRRLVLLGFALAFASVLRAEKLVTVLSTVAPAYARRHSTPASAEKPETYIFVRGRQIIPQAEKSIAKTDFTTIASTLAIDLTPPRFAPADNIETADLVLMVSWGATQEHDDGRSLLLYDPDKLRQASEAIETARAAEEADASLATRVMGATAAAEANYKTELQISQSLFSDDGMQAASNADLLGFRAAMGGDSDLAESLRAMANESRYFVIITAFDAVALREGRKVRLWTTRMSLRAAGSNFPQALSRMSGVAAHFHGLPQPGIALQDAKDRPAPARPIAVKIIAQPTKPDVKK